MKKIYSILSLLLLSSALIFAQAPANRTVSTIVADALVQFPSKKQADYNKSIDELLATKGEAVIELVKMMKAPEKADNNKIEYALSGISNSVAVKGKENERLETSNAYIKSLVVAGDRETKAFVIRQLETVAQDEAVETLASYLKDETLSGPATQALAAINSPASEKALMTALKSSQDNKKKVELLVALSFFNKTSDEAAIQACVRNNDTAVKKAAVVALGAIGTESSLKLLADEAKNVSYKMTRGEATESYAALLNKLLDEGNTKLVEKEAKNLFKAADKAQNIELKKTALRLQMGAKSADAIKLVKSELKNDDMKYVGVVLDIASNYADAALYTEVIKFLPKAGEGLKIQILNWLSTESDCVKKREVITKLATQSAIDALGDQSLVVKKAASNLLLRTGGHDAILELAGMLDSKDPEVVTIAKNALLSTKGDVATAVVARLKKAPVAGKVAALQVIANRKADTHLDAVLDQLLSTSPEVKTAAYVALKDVVVEGDLAKLYELLEAVDKDQVGNVQKAIISALKFDSGEEKAKTLFSRMKVVASSKQYLYFPLLATTDSPEALDLIVKRFKSEKGESQEAAFEALLSWKGGEAAPELFEIGKGNSSYASKAVDRYIALVSSPQMTGENRRLFLTSAMDIAKNNQQKRTILGKIAQTDTYLGLLFVAQYIDDANLKQAAAGAANRLVLNNKSFAGKEVEAIIAKVMETLNNPDAEYQRQALQKHINELPKGETGFVSIFNGKDLTGWQGLVENPMARARMSKAEFNKKKVKADKMAKDHWFVENGNLVFDGAGADIAANLCTEKHYGDIEMYVDWNLDPAGPEADAGIYLRGCPQVQIWDTSRVDVGAQVGSGGLYNNQENPSVPLKVADNKLGEWNTFFIKMKGDRVTVYLNGELVVDDIMLENYWDRSKPIPALEQLELQAHGSKVYYRNIYVKEIERPEPFVLSGDEKKEGFKVLFDGTNMHDWTGATDKYSIDEEGCMLFTPAEKWGGNVYTKQEYGNFVLRLEFQLTPGCNNGIGIRTPMDVDAAYHGMELQIIDNDAPVYAKLKKHQYHGSVYGIYAAKRGFLKPLGEWNYQEVIADGNRIKVILNGEVITDCDIKEETKNGTLDKKEHPGLFNKKGHIGFLGHGQPIRFKNIRIKELK